MATLTVKGVPEELITRLKREAALNRRSLNGEVLVRLERSLPPELPAREWMERVREIRESMNFHTTTAEIIAARDEGRE